MQKISVGTSPDFVMRSGLVELFHKGSVVAERGVTKSQIYSFHDQSLRGLFNKMKAVFLVEKIHFYHCNVSSTEDEVLAELSNSASDYTLSFAIRDGIPSEVKDSIRITIERFLAEFMKV